MNIVDRINPSLITSICVEAPFDQGKEYVEGKGYKMISAEENAKLRINQGKDAYVSKNGNWTREGFIYLPSKEVYITKNSPIMDNAKEATQSHREGKEYFLTEEQVQNAKSNFLKIPHKNSEIPTKRFGENEITKYLFGNTAEDYDLFLQNAGIKEMPIWLASFTDKPFARQMWFRYLDGRSGLGGGGYLDYDDRVRGVQNKTAEGGSQKS